MQVRFIPGAREKETGKESFNRTENRYWCPSLRRRRCVGRNQSREFGKLAPYLWYAIESVRDTFFRPRRGAYCLSLAGISRSQLQGGYDCLTSGKRGHHDIIQIRTQSYLNKHNKRKQN